METSPSPGHEKRYRDAKLGKETGPEQLRGAERAQPVHARTLRILETAMTANDHRGK
jgi:hypothetical protein